MSVLRFIALVTLALAALPFVRSNDTPVDPTIARESAQFDSDDSGLARQEESDGLSRRPRRPFRRGFMLPALQENDDGKAREPNGHHGAGFAIAATLATASTLPLAGGSQLLPVDPNPSPSLIIWLCRYRL